MIPDSIILSDDELLATDSETDHSEVDLSPSVKCDFESPHIADSDSFGSGATFNFARPMSDHRDEDGNNNSVPDNAKLQLAADYLRLRSASPGQTCATPQVGKLQVNTDST
jgi:hypothetical protein